jgi:rare lipoprotein A
MYLRAVVLAVSPVLLVSFFTAGCAKKKHVSATRPSPRSPAPPVAIPSTEVGLASWYGHPYHGRAAADGEIYDMEKMTAAHRTLPFNTWVRVTNLTNNKTVDVRIIDRGPFVDGRIIDLSHAAAREIDLIGPGVARVRVDVINAGAVQPSENLYAVQAGSFPNRAKAERLRASLEREYGAARLVYRDGNPAQWRVLVGSESTLDGATALARRVQGKAATAYVVRLDYVQGAQRN